MSIRKTPLIRCSALEALVGCKVYLKLECLQNTGSFKLRGATRAIAKLSKEERERGVMTASAGNHGAGLAYAAAVAGISATVVVPRRTPKNKQVRIRGLGANVRVDGENYDASEALARTLASERGVTFVSAFDDEEIIAGNGGDLGAEIFQQLDSVRAVLVPIGGGGLIAGMAEELSPKGVKVLGAQPANNCAMYDSLKQGKALCTYEKEQTIAEGCEGAVCERTYAIVAKHELDLFLVSEKAIIDAVSLLYTECGIIAETSAAVPVAALLEKSVPLQEDDVLVVVITGGNIDPADLDHYLATSPRE